MYSESKLYPNNKKFLDIFWTYFVQFAKLQNLHQCVQKVSKFLDTFVHNVTKIWTHFGQNLDTFCGKNSGTSSDNESLKILIGHNLDKSWTYFGHISDLFWTHLGHMPLGCIAYLSWNQSSDTKLKYI